MHYVAMNMPDGSTLNYNDSKKKMRNSLPNNGGTDKTLTSLHTSCLFCYCIMDFCRKKYLAMDFVILPEDSFHFLLHLSGVN
jgi:hypothetical protein